ncbi:MAG: indole-3-glycerol phosphate synthase TrpC, partial [Solirubrobacteraceae bacterium]
LTRLSRSRDPPIPSRSHRERIGAARMTGVLGRILDETRATVAANKRTAPLEGLMERSAEGSPRGFRRALERPGIGVIAEFKRRSPSAGLLREDADVAQIAAAYEQAGASAMSVLTEKPNFEGSLADLQVARVACDLPLLRKDFVVDAYQLYEARAAGADAVLLIVAALPAAELASLHETATGLGLDVLVEVHDSQELAIAASAGASLIGVNNRDLRDFSVDISRTSQLLAEMPPGACVVSESGISTPEQLSWLEAQGVAAVLVGETLMRAPQPGEALGVLRGSLSFMKPHDSL